MIENNWTIKQGTGPVVATAIHDGHEVRSEVARLLDIDENDRLREEDPFTGILTEIAENRIIVRQSRFEFDLNRPREKAVYRKPEDAWGLKLWKQPIPEEVIERSIRLYDSFYKTVYSYLKDMEKNYGRFIVLDLHSYCYMRNGADLACEPDEANPDVNIGTGSMNRSLWANVTDRFIGDLRDFEFLGKHLDVRENIRFRGGHFSKWIHETFPATGCCLAVEIKKMFMGEWSGLLYEEVFGEIKNALLSAVPGITNELRKPVVK